MSLEKLVDLIDNNTSEDKKELAEAIWKSGFLIPEDKYRQEIKDYKSQLKAKDTEWKTKYDELDLEHHNLKTANMTEAEKQVAEIERLTKLANEATLKINRSEAKAKLAKVGITDEEKIDNIIATYVSEDAVQSAKSLDLYVSTFKELEKQIKDNVENEILENQKPDNEGTPPAEPEPADEVDAIIDEVWD